MNTKQYFYHFVLLFGLMLLESAGVPVQLVLLFVVAFALLPYSFGEVLWASFAAGMFYEFYSGFGFGTYIAAASLTGIAVYVITRHVTSQQTSWPNMIFLIVVSTLLFSLVAAVYNFGADFRSFFGGKTAILLLANLVFFYPVMFLLNLLRPK